MSTTDLYMQQLRHLIDTQQWDGQSFDQQLLLLEQLRRQRRNNATVRKTILRTLLTADTQLWPKHKRTRALLAHAWGQRSCSILGAILLKPETEWDEKEQRIVHELLGAYFVSRRGRSKLMDALREALH